MSSYISWNQLTSVQQQLLPVEYQNQDIPLVVLQQNNVKLTPSQKSVFSESPTQQDVTNYTITDFQTEPKSKFWSKAAEIGEKLLVSSGVGIVAGLLASILFPVGGAVVCGILAGAGTYLYATKKKNQAKQQAAQQAAYQQQAPAPAATPAAARRGQRGR